MIRSGTINTIHELAAQGKSIREIARTVGIARNTVRRYLRGKPEAVPRPKRDSKLDAYKGQIRKWMQEDHLYNCETMLPRLQEQGYTGSLSTLKAFVQAFRPRKAGHQPVIRYETKPGEQMQFDWGEFHYEEQGRDHKLYGFTAVLSYSRMRFVTFVKRCDTPTMIRCLMEAFEYFAGLPKAALTDRMKSVFLEMDGNSPKWNPLFADFMACIGVAPRVCKPYTPQTKGKVERSVGVIKNGFWPAVHFTDIDDLNEQARIWCDRLNQKRHRTTLQAPVERWGEENLSPLPKDFAWERFGTEERRVSWDGFISYDGVLYGLPSQPTTAGSLVLVRERGHELRVFHQGQLVVTLQKRPRSQDIVLHPQQFEHVAPAASLRQAARPIGHQVQAPSVAIRELREYDQLFGVEVMP
ncbi:MAG TPA: IS21 family transposase [Ktedonobacteraceae bacterium]|nr:IS21 family transposase [Ktedonobacteraceae bacterium]